MVHTFSQKEVDRGVGREEEADDKCQNEADDDDDPKPDQESREAFRPVQGHVVDVRIEVAEGGIGPDGIEFAADTASGGAIEVHGDQGDADTL